MAIMDSGERREFETGAVRDIGLGKGRCDLLPLSVLTALFQDNTFANIDLYVRTGDITKLVDVIIRFSTQWVGSLESAMLEVSKHFEEGALKYSERNWEKGIHVHCYIDSAIRHYLKFKRGDDDERHDRAFLWNILCALWTHINKPEMIDLPFMEKGEDI